MHRYRWALRPGWIFSHVFVATCVFLFIWAGLWQLSRLHGRREANALIASRELSQPVPIDQLLALDAGPDRVGAATFRQVKAVGAYRRSEQVLVNNRSNNGSPGYWVITPLDLGDGTSVVVNRGWIPLIVGDSASADVFAAPEGTVSVTGLVLDTQRQEGIGASDPADGTLSHLSRVDVPRLQKQVVERMYPVYLNLIDQQPAQKSAGPYAVPTPLLDDGPHLDYAGQWLLFATMTCVVYPLLLRRTARHKEIDARQEAFDAEHADLSALDQDEFEPAR